MIVMMMVPRKRHLLHDRRVHACCAKLVDIYFLHKLHAYMSGHQILLPIYYILYNIQVEIEAIIKSSRDITFFVISYEQLGPITQQTALVMIVCLVHGMALTLE